MLDGRKSGGRPVKYLDHQFEDAIVGSRGLYTVIASRVGCNAGTAKRRITVTPALLELYEAEMDRLLDQAERVVFDAIDIDDVQTAKWFLSTRGRIRGYSTKQQVETSSKILVTYADDWDEHGVDGTPTKTT